MQYVLDTHALVWYVTADNRLGKDAYAALQSIDGGTSTGVVSVLVLSEIMYLEQKGRISVKLDELIEKLKTSENYRIVPMTLDTLNRAKQLTDIPELFDRMIAATALEHEGILLTRDSVFTSLPTIKTAW